jgi:hypothetical protein
MISIFEWTPAAPACWRCDSRPIAIACKSKYHHRHAHKSLCNQLPSKKLCIVCRCTYLPLPADKMVCDSESSASSVGCAAVCGGTRATPDDDTEASDARRAEADRTSAPGQPRRAARLVPGPAVCNRSGRRASGGGGAPADKRRRNFQKETGKGPPSQFPARHACIQIQLGLPNAARQILDRNRVV